MKASLFTTLCLVMVLAACGQPVQETAASAEPANDQSETEPMNPTVRTALELVPAARPYIDPQNGRFDYGAARSELGPVEARELRSIWRAALREAQITAN
jgi:hypothetical protein